MRVNKILILAAASVAAFSVTASAVAAVAVPFGWYVEGNIGQSRTSGVTYASGSSVHNTGFGWNVNLGYKFMPYFAAEVGYTGYAQTTAKALGLTIARDSHHSYDIAGKGIIPITDSGFDIFAKLGLARSQSHVTAPNTVSGYTVSTGTNRSTNLYFGLGGDYALTPNLLGNLQWARSRSNSSIGNLDLYSIGLGFTFG